jgi:flagellar hook-length control protein FliK
MTKDTPQDNIQELTDEIERAREELGETVEALAAKADVKARQQVTDSTAQAAATAWEATPEPVRQAARQAMGTARKRQVTLAVAAGILVGGWLILRWRRR